MLAALQVTQIAAARPDQVQPDGAAFLKGA